MGTYRIGGLNPAGSTDKNYDFVGSLSSAPGVSYVHSYYQPSGSLVYPDTFGDREKGYFGPNFQFNNVGGGAIPTDRAWRDDISGDWHEVSNWLPLGVPNDDTQTATFGDVINQPRVVFLDTDVTVKKVVFLSTNRYAVTGTGIVNLDAGTSPDPSSFDVLLGDHEFQAKVRLHTDTEVTIAGGTSLTFNNTLDLGGNTLTKLEAGDLRIRNDLVTGGGMINVLQGTVSGNGTVGGDLNNDGGAISPGNPSAVPLSGVPEPSTFLMLAVGFLSVVVCWTRGRSRV